MGTAFFLQALQKERKLLLHRRHILLLRPFARRNVVSTHPLTPRNVVITHPFAPQNDVKTVTASANTI